MKKWLKDYHPNHPKRINNNSKSFADQHILKMISFHGGEKNWKKVKKKNPEIALNIHFVSDNDIEYVKDLETDQAFTS